MQLGQLSSGAVASHTAKFQLAAGVPVIETTVAARYSPTGQPNENAGNDVTVPSPPSTWTVKGWHGPSEKSPSTVAALPGMVNVVTSQSRQPNSPAAAVQATNTEPPAGRATRPSTSPTVYRPVAQPSDWAGVTVREPVPVPPPPKLNGKQTEPATKTAVTSIATLGMTSVAAAQLPQSSTGPSVVLQPPKKTPALGVAVSAIVSPGWYSFSPQPSDCSGLGATLPLPLLSARSGRHGVDWVKHAVTVASAAGMTYVVTGQRSQPTPAGTALQRKCDEPSSAVATSVTSSPSKYSPAPQSSDCGGSLRAAPLPVAASVSGKHAGAVKRALSVVACAGMMKVVREQSAQATVPAPNVQASSAESPSGIAVSVIPYPARYSSTSHPTD